MNVQIINGSPQYRALFESLGHTLVGPDKAELVVFTGGADVTPSLYGDTAHELTGCSPERDRSEMKVFEECVRNGIPMAGICRGGQILNVLSGGRMYQHVERHCRPHMITDVETGESIYVSSTHHQMMMPSPRALVVATAALGGEREWFDGQVAQKDVSKEDIEVVYYEHTKALCFQPHPEFSSVEYEGMKQYFKGLLSRFLNVK